MSTSSTYSTMCQLDLDVCVGLTTCEVCSFMSATYTQQKKKQMKNHIQVEYE